MGLSSIDLNPCTFHFDVMRRVGAWLLFQDEQLAEQQVKEVMISRNRNGSVMSRHSTEANTPQLSRVGSLQSKALVKQESTLSAMSHGSGGSGTCIQNSRLCTLELRKEML